MEKTGRYLIVLDPNRKDEAVSKISAIAGLIADSREFTAAPEKAANESSVLLHHIGVAVSDLDPDQAVGVRNVDEVRVVEAERYVYAIAPSSEYELGFRDGVDALYRASKSGGGIAALLPRAAAPLDESQITWGLQLIKIPDTHTTGEGVKVAVLDTGLDLQHPDFTARGPVATQSFVSGTATVQDGHGHGTHCCGTINGPSSPSTGPRYGVAPHASLYVGKVLDDSGSGRDGDILNGINWAIGERCDVISMSLGAPVAPGAPPSLAYEQAAKVALDQGTLIVAAAGNESRRPGMIAPVGHPANCPSVLAVAAVDDSMLIAFFSCGQVGSGKAPGIAGPGVQIYSSWPLPRRYNTISGTSMATPHVAGVAALLVEARGVRGSALTSALTSSTKTIGLPASDAGSGLVQAP